ncbi:MAG TPA: TldD/PmbA family protein [Thermotogota bacterium]|nr:TldD/PmbA family protein [Thermotogota bacterium]
MYQFPAGLYSDVRIETLFETRIQITLGKLEQMNERKTRAAFVRVFDGKRWYYASTTDLGQVQNQLNRLASMATPDPAILEHPVVQKFEVNRGDFIRFKEGEDVSLIPIERKKDLLMGYTYLVEEEPKIKMWTAHYIDQRKVKEFSSSKGAQLSFDFQRTGFRLGFQLAHEGETFKERFDRGANRFSELGGLDEKIRFRVEKAINFLLHAEPVEPGPYPVILSPEAAGVFAHESFGHKSEADMMLGDETMKQAWKIGTPVGVDMLSIVDDGNLLGSGYTPFDEDGTAARETYLVKNGVLSGRLHSAYTASELEEPLTGNARALNFEFEPLVRMTTTYIKEGNKTLFELVSEMEDGILVETINHGSGMSTFTIAPSLAFRIRKGTIAEPVKISVVTGNVFETLHQIDGLSNRVELLSFVMGGCGKMEQGPLPVGFGGPYVRVKKLDVR